MAIKSKKSNVSTVVWVTTLIIVLVSVFVLSGNFSKLMTTIVKTKASLSNPKLTRSFGDAFKTDVLSTDAWTPHAVEGATIVQTTSDNLRITVPSGSSNNKAKSANIAYKEIIGKNGDFRVIAVLYRPIVTGEGMGVSGIRFASKGTDNDEGATIQWRVSGANSSVTFTVRGVDGQKLESQQDSLATNIAVLRIDRVNKKYRAFYKVGNDLTGDTNWKRLGGEFDSTLGSEGYVSLFTSNVGAGDKFPKVMGRFDQVNIAWEDASVAQSQIKFADAFANGNVGKLWKVGGSDGAQIYENPSDNLIMPVLAGASGTKPRYSVLNRTEPLVGQGKNFVIQASVFKPTIVLTDVGIGQAGVRFISTNEADDEGASVRWVVGKQTVNNAVKNVSKLIFSVRGADAQSVDIPAAINKLTIRLTREGTAYKAWYRTGDADTDFVMIGHEQNGNFDATGKIGLAVSNVGFGGKFPRVVGRFDQVNGWVSK